MNWAWWRRQPRRVIPYPDTAPAAREVARARRRLDDMVEHSRTATRLAEQIRHALGGRE